MDSDERFWLTECRPGAVKRIVPGTPNRIISARIELVAAAKCPPSGSSGQHSTDQHRAATRPGQWYLLLKGVAACNGYGDPIDQPRRSDRRGVPASPALRPGPHGLVLRRRGILPGLRRSLLLPLLARVRDRLRLLPRGHGKSLGLTLVGLHGSDDHLGVN